MAGIAIPVEQIVGYRIKITVSTEGQIALPAEIRRQDGIEPGQELDMERVGRGEYRLKGRSMPKNQGLVDWLLACPEKGFFVPIESERTGGTRAVTYNGAVDTGGTNGCYPES